MTPCKVLVLLRALDAIVTNVVALGTAGLQKRVSSSGEIPFPFLPAFWKNAPEQKKKKKETRVRPNIIFFMTDSMDGRMVDESHPESKVVELPFLRGFFGKRGANFVRAYSNNPMCVPSRASMMTGRSSDRIDVYGNNQGLAASPDGVLDDMCIAVYKKDNCQEWADAQGYPETIFSTFQKLGYNVRAEGRLHIGGAYMNAQKHNSSVEGKFIAQPFDPQTLDETTHYADVRVSATNALYTKMLVNDGNGWPIPASRPFAALDWPTVDHCRDWIRQLPHRMNNSQPFFLFCSFNLPHYEYATNSTWLKKVNQDLVTVPTWLEGFPEKWHPYDVFKSFSMGTHREYTRQDIRKMRKIYYAMVAETDAMLSAVWSELRQKGYSLKNTYVLHVSDHGEMKFEHRQMYKASMYEGSVRVPLQIAGPGVGVGTQKQHLVSLLDIFPTLLDMARVTDWQNYSALMGKSILEAAGAESHAPSSMKLLSQDNRNFVFSQYSWLFSNTGAFMVRSGVWKYITFGRTFSAFKDYKPQLFNVENDPEELRDVSEENPAIIAELDARLREVLDPDEVDKRVAELNFKRVIKGMTSLAEYEHAANFSISTFNKMKDFECEPDAHNKLNKWFYEATDMFGAPFHVKGHQRHTSKSHAAIGPLERLKRFAQRLRR